MFRNKIILETGLSDFYKIFFAFKKRTLQKTKVKIRPVQKLPNVFKKITNY